MSPNYCRAATGTTSANCRPGTRTEMSSIYRARTQQLVELAEPLVPTDVPTGPAYPGRLGL
jgi:hypothetical protein